VFQNVGQAHVPPAQASLLLSLESVFGVLFSVLFFGEELTLQLALGFTLVFCAILLSELAPRRT
jgi:drug/metabolite transporter (DMT)-like permease